MQNCLKYGGITGGGGSGTGRKPRERANQETMDEICDKNNCGWGRGCIHLDDRALPCLKKGVVVPVVGVVRVAVAAAVQ